MNKLLIWNINQRAGFGESFYPKFVLNCFNKEFDIIIFTEFYKHNDWEKIFLNENLVFSPYTTFFSLVESTHMVEKSTSIIPHIPAQREKPVAL